MSDPALAMDLAWQWRPFAALSGREVHELLALRARVFVVEQACAYLDPDAHDLAAEHLLGRRAGELVAYARAYAEPGRWRLGRLVTAPEVRRQGLGRALLAELLHRLGDRELFVHAQTYLLPFYRGFGFLEEGDLFEEDGIPHRAMRRRAGTR